MGLEVREISFSYGKNEIYKDFSLKQNHNITGIIGVNGAGKSTLLKLSTGILPLLKGKIYLNGHNIEAEREKSLRQIGVLFENPVFPKWAKTLKFLRWVGRLRGLSYIVADKNAKILLSFLGLSNKYDAPISKLSAGQRQRFGIAQALIGLPPLLLLDEPTANLDVKGKIEILSFLKELANENSIEIIIFSHVMGELEKFVREVIVLHKGKIVYQNSINKAIKEVPLTHIVVTGNEDTINQLILLLEKMNEVLDLHFLKISPSEIEITTNNSKIGLTSLKKEIENLYPGLLIRDKYSPLERLFIKYTGENRKNIALST